MERHAEDHNTENQAEGLAGAETALRSLDRYSGDRSEIYDDDIIDLITDLLHFADSKGWSAAKIIILAENHFYAERDGGYSFKEEGNE